jgi:hypothetical protein
MSGTKVVRRLLLGLMLVLIIFIAGTTATGSPWQVWSWGLLHLAWTLWAWARLRGPSDRETEPASRESTTA